MKSAYDKGDQVIINNSIYGTVQDTEFNSLTNKHRYLVDFGGLYSESWYDESSLQLVKKADTNTNKNIYTIKCECGAGKTSFPDFHSDWCPAYTNMKGN